MSTIVKYSNGSTYTLVANKVEIEKVQELGGQYHTPYSSIVGMVRLGLDVQKITVSGDILDMSACLWHDVVAISFDSGTSYQTVYFSGVPYTSDCWSGIYPYTLELLASPLKERTAVRYPTTGYKWGNQSITGISQAGNVAAKPIIHYLAPLFYAPLSNTLIDITGQAVTFTRTAPKTHNGVVYPINTPIFDSGLYLASDTAQDVATWTPPASTVRTIAMQIKQTRFPPVFGPLTNLITNGAFETNIMGWGASGVTLSRETGTPLVGTGSLKALVTAVGHYTTANVTSVIGHTYYFSGLFRSTAAAGRKVRMGLGAFTTAVNCSASAQTLSVTFVAISTTSPVFFQLDGDIANEYILADSIVCYDVTSMFGGVSPLTVWTGAHNFLTIDIANNLLKWNDSVSTIVSVAFPTATYLAGTVIDLALLDDTSHAVTLAVHPAGGSWTSATGTLAAITWPQLTLGNLEGSIANLIQYPYVLTTAEYQALAYSSLSLLFNGLYVGNRYTGEIVKGDDGRLVNALGADISALLGGTDIAIGSAAVTIAQSQGMSARWYVEVKRTDV